VQRAIGSQNALVRPVGFAALAMTMTGTNVWELASGSRQGRLDFLAAVPMVPVRQRAALRPHVVECLAESQPAEVRQAALVALAALAAIPSQETPNFRLAASLVGTPSLRTAAVRTLLAVPPAARPADDAAKVVDALVRHAEATPAARRTTDEFLDAMQLADQLMGLLPPAASRSYRDRLRAVTVRVVKIKTVHEEMRYDTPHFAVEAGRPVQLVLRNEDLMPHNLVITRPGTMRDVALEAALLPPQPDKSGLAYVPASPNVLFATRMVEPDRQAALTFTAPREPGEYPYVCTFPNHWMRMYGVMVVVPDLDAWLASPTTPTDPLGNTRALVRNWTIDDLQGDLPHALRGRSAEIGRQLFKEATCLPCHKVRGEGGAVGPELTDVFVRWKGDHLGVLREMIEPSHKIEPKYALFNVLTSDGRIYSGIMTDQNAETITVITNPDNPQPQVIARDDINEMMKASTSMMPKGLLDRFTKDEIFELLSYLEQAAKAGN
jgi:putative heme-binding domain-containing protein